MADESESATDEIRYVEVDFILDVTCNHSRQSMPEPIPPERTVARVIHVPPIPGARGFIEWREAVKEEAPNYPAAVQTYYGEARRLGTIGLRKADGSGLAPNEYVRGMEGQRWRFWCQDCRDTLPLNHSKLLPLLQKFMEHKVPSVSMAGLAARV